ncbi:hypothetical protein [Paractinoplanes rishiriensis]|uniref:Uncharacterized protein n=1 Tax=Paractinoplanes rishiriensis TaxID=1050105 RepID=A0A919K8T5_9ACTN|nr:hypothetical protein [Actinoplanes rishiriensis]GIF00961.1 hypothetical protein Ari01nite_84250 [Actinoplanes rishiriensis]
MIAAAVDWNAVEALAASAAALLTAAVLVVTVVALLFERRVRRIDIARLEAQRADAEAGQASLVVSVTSATTGSGTADVVLVNYSQRPVFDVHVSLTLNGRPVTLTDGRCTVVPVQTIVGPDERRELTLNAPYGEETLVAARTELRDAMGLRWRRDHNGRPERLLTD